MFPCPLLAALAAGLALSGPAPEVAVHRLRNVAAADAAVALTAYAAQHRIGVTVAARPEVNAVLVVGAAAPRRRVAAVLAEMDRAPAQVLVGLVVLEAPAGFAEDVGLSAGEAGGWVLTPREVRMLGAAVRRGEERGEVEVLSRPHLVVADNQTGVVQVAGADRGLAARVTPRVVPDGSVLVRSETRITAGGAGESVTTVETTARVPAGGSVVVRCPRPGGREVLVVGTVNRIEGK